MKICYMMVGLPGSGKSTVARKLYEACPPHTISFLSTDDYIETVAKLKGQTYRDVFTDTIDEAVKAVDEAMQTAISSGQDIIIDNTHLTVASRQRKLAKLPICYHRIAIVVQRPEWETWNYRLNNRPGKSIPQSVIDDMLARYEPPTVEEGFNQIWSRHS